MCKTNRFRIQTALRNTQFSVRQVVGLVEAEYKKNDRNLEGHDRF